MKLQTVFAIAAVAASATFASNAFAERSTLKVEEKVEVAAPPANVWEKLKNFNDMSWHPGFASTELTKGENNKKGAIRVLTTKDGAKLTEELEAYSDKGHSYKYRINESPLPISDYVSIINVNKAKDGKSVVIWKSSFKRKDEKPAAGQDDEGVKKLISGVYVGGLDHLKKSFEK